MQYVKNIYITVSLLIAIFFLQHLLYANKDSLGKDCLRAPLLFTEKKEGLKVIFLDIDGVLNSYNYMDVLYLKGERSTAEEKSTPALDPQAVENLRIIVERTGAKIVVTSNWRNKGLQWIQELWKQNRLPGNVIDITPQRRNRVFEIRRWLKSKHVENYVVLDDDFTDIEVRMIGVAHFVDIHPKYGLREDDVRNAAKLLNSKDSAVPELNSRASLRSI
ncbi:MAG: HAD domain-containing protein [Candidatus Omnitrophota bacterium]